MPSLTTCLREAAQYLPPEVVASITKRASEMKAEGVPADQMGRLAVAEHAKRAGDDLAVVEKAHADGVTLYASAEPKRAAGADGQAQPAAPRFPDDLKLTTGEFDHATGEPRTVSANEHIAALHAEAEHVKGTAQRLMETAATCLLGGGA